jgi:WD40 repeat protein
MSVYHRYIILYLYTIVGAFGTENQYFFERSIIFGVAFNSDGHILTSGSDDGTVQLWDIEVAESLKMLIREIPYEHMNITKVSGLTEAQKTTLKVLGAIEDDGLALL